MTNNNAPPTPIPAAAPALSLELEVDEGSGEDVPAVDCAPAPVADSVAPSTYTSAIGSFIEYTRGILVKGGRELVETAHSEHTIIIGFDLNMIPCPPTSWS